MSITLLPSKGKFKLSNGFPVGRALASPLFENVTNNLPANRNKTHAEIQRNHPKSLITMAHSLTKPRTTVSLFGKKSKFIEAKARGDWNGARRTNKGKEA